MKKNATMAAGHGMCLAAAGNDACNGGSHFHSLRTMGKLLCATALLGASINTSFGQTIPKHDTSQVQKLHKVIVSDVIVDNKIPLTTSTINRAELDEARTEVSLPFMLETRTSVVAYGENGTIGGSYIRIRGVEPSRINVNLNGITLNDPESQQVFWYNIPNLGGMAQSLQIQRGVGASTGGSPAFGAAINMQTLNARNKPYGGADLSYGSWNTRQYGVNAGTGIMKNGLSFDFAYSGLTSDGYIRSWGTDQQSLFASISWYSERTLIKLLTIMGKQKTGITWNGASEQQLDEDPTYNSAGEYDMDGNTMYYPNETDNYWQQHYQLYVSHLFNDKWSIKGALDFTHGGGYFEQYMTAWSDYNNSPFYGLSDVVFQKRMNNYTYTANVALNHTGKNLTFSIGDNLIYYDGDQWGQVKWLRDTSIHADLPLRWYDNTSDKWDNSIYAKATYDFSKDLNVYADMQFRIVDYRIHGNSDDVFTSPAYGLYIGLFDLRRNYYFFNPKVGVNYRINDHQRTYFVAGVNNREPVRFDIMNAVANNDTIKAETLLDFELGYQIAKSRWAFNANIYAMLYKDQMTPNGDVLTGYALMENVDKSYRIGIELEGGYKFAEWFRVDANLTLSQNKVLDFTYSEFENGDTDPISKTGTTDLALSPSVIGSAIATFIPVKNAKLQIIGHYVGKQYADNTSRECYAIDPYFLLNIKASYTWHLQNSNEIEAQFVINNLLDHNYRLNAWAGDWTDTWTTPGTTYYYHDRTYLQQPGINCLARIAYKF